uniref:Uncharacterized protein n=1 Tax=viral metagenome TaxID=1070528 RepID=A0A6M3L3T0_9ZZZZ
MYELRYSPMTGKVSCIVRDGKDSIPICEANSYYQEFLKWNKTQKTPLDLKSTVPIVSPLPVGTVDQRIDKLEARVAILEK